ncbi:MAG: InlB B-repeat-containing protein [Clostridia bacterium]|nr:InlB B-repeat-containing protein [Clostridia bacterium]
MKRFGRLLTVVVLAALLLCIAHSSALAYNTGDDYPSKYKSRPLDALVDDWNFYSRECTSFVAWCLNTRNGIPFTNQYAGASKWGNAGEWAGVARSLGYVVDGNPAVGAVAWWSSGHVGWVSEVNGTSVTTEEYNWKKDGAFHRRTQQASTISGFIHIKDIQPTGALDVNFYVNDKEIVDIAGIGTFDLTVAGSTLTGQTDYSRSGLANGAAYAVSNITPAEGYVYIGLGKGSDTLTGTIPAGGQRTIWLLFESRKYSILYDANGGTGEPDSQTKTHGTALTLSSVVPTREEYDFLGWAVSSAATKAAYQPGGQYTSDESQTLYAVWSLKKYTVTFNPNGGTVDPAVIQVPYGSAWGTLPVPVRTGYTFDGWFTAVDGGSRVTADTMLTEKAEQTVYAHWSPRGEMTFAGAVQAIEEEAFSGDSLISHVVIPEGCSSIGSKAFANCGNLVSVRILGKNTVFESDTFEGSSSVVIYCYSGSKAQRLASADGLEYHLIGVESDWVPAGDVPQGAEITDRKWTYTLREYTEKSSASYEGWTKYDAKRTSWTDWSKWQGEEVSASTDREVRTEEIVTGYNMITYCVSGPNGRSYQPSPTYTLRLQHGPYWWSVDEFNAARVFAAGSYFDYASNVAGYVLDATGYCKWDGSDTGGFVPMFIQNKTTSTVWSYRDAVYTYYYYRDTNKEASEDPSGQENVSDVQELVKYVY